MYRSAPDPGARLIHPSCALIDHLGGGLNLPIPEQARSYSNACSYYLLVLTATRPPIHSLNGEELAERVDGVTQRGGGAFGTIQSSGLCDACFLIPSKPPRVPHFSN